MRKFTSGQSGIEPTSGSAKKPAVDRHGRTLNTQARVKYLSVPMKVQEATRIASEAPRGAERTFGGSKCTDAHFFVRRHWRRSPRLAAAT
jgi:hypothetical protein